MVRTSVTVPKSLKEEMDRTGINWSEAIREAIKRRLVSRSERDTIEAVLINERSRKKAPSGWDSTKAIKFWRGRRP